MKRNSAPGNERNVTSAVRNECVKLQKQMKRKLKMSYWGFVFFTVNQKRLRVKLTAADRGWTYISTLYVWVIISQQTLNVHPLCFQHCWLCKNVIVGLCSGSYARSVQAASYTEFPASLNDELRSNWEQKKPTQIQRQMHWFKRGISKDQKWTPFFPSLPSSPSHTHTAHILCVITIHWTRGGVHPGRPSHTGGVITPVSDSWPCLKFSYYSPKSLI